MQSILLTTSIFDFPFGFNEKSSLLLIFFFHGIIFSLLLLRNGIKTGNKASKWLSLLLFLCALYLSPYMFGYAGWYYRDATADILFFLPLMQVLLIGPVVFFYTKSLLNVDFKMTKAHLIHFIPAILYDLYSLVVFITDKLILDEYYFYADGRDKDLSNWYQMTGLISMSFYLVLSLRHYSQYKRLVFDTVSYAETILFQWIRNFMIAFLAMLILRLMFFIINPDWGEFGSQFWYYLSFACVVYYISINGFANAVKVSTIDHVKFAQINVFEADDLLTENVPTESLIEKELEDWKTKLLNLMEGEALYKNPRLTLSDVANALETNTKLVSSIVNSGYQMNFNDFINHHRIEAIKKKLQNGEHKTTTLLGIALDCGFNSKATFNRAFKKSTELSPKDFITKMT
ncbi:helix-turn-helix domain-containing protein [Psychroserpens sp.]|uniref:helix-turn-helix domain-containing protein n=1 Tax=Psychroserpens sp. TaxID=2020870 RepID=UPI001B2C3A6C|nr:helix-turn-helix domain-containing protein [Psychroserpens sp.]MBO6605522.1 helix-turn-helix domain-containing protein [Psychroserpens sp.]MBO6630195.1 helix-turn-helix domain-containing protein [Psychroserpens sp.]MBO6653669.1 helix-turn-helix domain-containing protein [Psychroserpens sp.]MBO6681990.1 helix-turn-helix domain-containing protein [Psychroserpens sp.]MBO6748896.1 helix-turn-helix domain-containing protein [Psychroserpens sp.]